MQIKNISLMMAIEALKAAISANDTADVSKLLGLFNYSHSALANVFTQAVSENLVDMVRLFASRTEGNWLVNHLNIEDDTLPLMWASDLNMVTLLCTLGANVNAVNENGSTPLMQHTGSPEIVRFLIDCGAKLDARDVTGESAVFYCLLAKNPMPSLSILVDAGASLEASPRSGDTPLTFLCQWYRDLDTAKETMDYLLRKGVPVDALNHSGYTALKYLCRKKDQTNLLKHLIQVGKPNLEVHSKTAFMVAAEHGAWESMNKLFRMGANVNARTNDGKTAIDLAAASRYSNFDTLVRLVRYGCIFNPVAHNQPFTNYMRTYPSAYIHALCEMLGDELAMLVNDIPNAEVCRKMDLEDNTTIVPMDDLFRLPYHKLQDGLVQFIERSKAANFYTSLPGKSRILDMIKAISLAAHNSSQTKEKVLDQAKEFDIRYTKKHRVSTSDD